MSMQIIMGAPGQGKSPYAQKMIEGRRCLVFDVNNEYGLRTKYPGQRPIGLSHNTKEPRCRFIGTDLNVFMQLALSKKDTVVIFEEATMFFRGKLRKETSQLIIGRIHTGNHYLFLFHSINRVPPEIMEIADLAVLFRTNDEEATVQRKYSRLYPAFMELKKPDTKQPIIMKMI